MNEKEHDLQKADFAKARSFKNAQGDSLDFFLINFDINSGDHISLFLKNNEGVGLFLEFERSNGISWNLFWSLSIEGIGHPYPIKIEEKIASISLVQTTFSIMARVALQCINESSERHEIRSIFINDNFQS